MIRIAIVGGGIAGLAAAWELRPLAESGRAEVTLFEASERLGGAVRTDRESGAVIECGPDSFLARKPEGITLVREMGMDKELVEVRNPGSYLYLRGKFRPFPPVTPAGLPASLSSMAHSHLLSPAGKLRALGDLFVPRSRSLSRGEDVSLGDFLRRRMGREIVEHLAGPVAGGTHLTDIHELSLRATYPDLARMEKEHRSLLLALLRERTPSAQGGAPRSPFLTLRNGLSSLVEGIEARLPANAVRKSSPVETISRGDGGQYFLRTGGREEGPFDGLVLSAPAPALSAMLSKSFPELARAFSEFRYSPLVVVGLVYPQVPENIPLDKGGFMVPRDEPLPISGVSWATRKWGFAPPEGGEVLRVYLDEKRNPGILSLSDEEILERARKGVATTMGITGAPRYSRVYRHGAALPQYAVGHPERVARVRSLAAQWPRVALAGALLEGVGLADCIRTGREAARRLTKGIAEPSA